MHGLSKHLHKKDGITSSFCTGIPLSILCGEKKLIMSVKCQYLPSIETFCGILCGAYPDKYLRRYWLGKPSHHMEKRLLEYLIPCAKGDHSVALFSYIAVIGDL